MSVLFKHALVIGGTGMLAGATRRIAAHSDAITLVARDTSPMAELVGSTSANFVGVDYTEVEVLRASLHTARELSGNFDVAVLWIHSVGEVALEALAEMFGEQEAPPRTMHVIGTRGRGMPHPRLAELPELVYQRVLLGHVEGPGGRRWLTHEEISAGVWAAIVSGDLETVVGELD